MSVTPSPAAQNSAAALNIPGLHLLLDFVTAEEEASLLAAVDAAPWVDMAKRRVQHYGYRFDYVVRQCGVWHSPS